MLFDTLNGAVQMGTGFRMHREIVGAGLGKVGNAGIRIRHHEMDVEGEGGHFSKRFDNGRADRQVRNKMPVHHVHVQQVGSRGFHRGDFVGQVRKVGRENRRGNVYGCGTHLLRSSKSCGKKSVHIVTETGREEISVRVRQGMRMWRKPTCRRFMAKFRVVLAKTRNDLCGFLRLR